MSLRFRGSLAAPAGSLCALLLATTAMPAFAADTSPPAPADSAHATDADDQPEANADDQNIIVVTGVREAEIRAIEAKKDADNITETLMANDVGKLPDQNVAEAVKRLPGITVENDQGEGRYVTIRGASPNLTNVTVNGQTAPAPEPDGRQVKLDDIPSSLIGSVVVHKTLTPDLDANAIAGQVDINTLTAFDRQKPFAYARAAAGINDLSGRVPYEFEGTAGSRFGSDDQFGAVISGNYSKRPIRSQNIQGSSNWKNGKPDDFRMRDYNLTRERWGLVGNFDWKPSDTAHLFLRTLYSTFKDHETRDQFRIETPTGPTGRGSRLIRVRNEDDSTLNLQAGGNFDFGGARLDVEGTYAKALKKDPLRSEYNFRTDRSPSKAPLKVSADLSDFLFTVTTDEGANDPTRFGFNTVNYEHRRAEENLYQGRIDFTLPFGGLGEESSIKVGAKYLQRDKTNDIEATNYDRNGTTSLAQTGAAQFTGVSLYDGRYFFGPVVNYDLAEAFFAANPGKRVRNPDDSLADSVVSDYDISEKIWAGYVMATLKFGDWTVIPGVRVEHTDGDYRGKAIETGVSTVDPGFNIGVKRSYTDWFPGLNVKYAPNDRLVVRAAVTTAIGRPDYSQLAPYVQVEDETVAMGNPYLEPYKAINGDFAVEYYLPGHGLLSATFFYKDIDNPIYEQTLTRSGNFGGQQIDDAEVDTFVNLDHARLYGFELNAQVHATFLPSPWDGFGIGANYSHTWGNAKGAPDRPGDIPLFGQSDDVATAQLFYEKGRVAMRVAWSYRSAYLDGLGDSPDTDQFTGGNGQLDARASFALSKNATVFVEGTNLTDAPWRRYQGNKTQLIENERYSYTAKGGFQLAF